ncbi:MAG TPA: hypothetical protein VN604_10105 [Nitrospirota bacterium]|nr:hypothetical protein [Nitrospirota bacterium]
MQIERILDDYRAGSADKRMSLFLHYRELRDEFASIEQSDPADIVTASLAERHGRLQRLIRLVRETFTRMSPGGSPDRAES